MNKIKKAKFAGSFYPGSKDSLLKEISDLDNNSKKNIEIKKPACVILPHAGYIYSGQCAVDCLRLLKKFHYNRIVVIAPSHRVSGFNFSIGDYDEFEIPSGNVKTDRKTIESLLKSDHCSFYSQPFAFEHSLEVQLPLLKYFLGDFKLIPIVISNQHKFNSALLGDILLRSIDDIENTLFVASTDLSHFHDANTAEKLDNIFINCIEKGNSEKMQDKLANHETEACGFGAVMTIMHIAEKLNSSNPRIVSYTHSGMVTGDNSEVVGYMSAVFESSK